MDKLKWQKLSYAKLYVFKNKVIPSFTFPPINFYHVIPSFTFLQTKLFQVI